MPGRKRLTLHEYVERLRRMHGTPKPPPTTDPYELALAEAAAYLVDDDRRKTTLATLKREVGLSPADLLTAPPGALARALREGGMLVGNRAAKVRRAAEVALNVGVSTLRRLVKESPVEARRVLRRFPGIGEPGADRMLLFGRGVASLAPDSNALRVLLRLGYGQESKDYGRAYKSVAAAVAPELGRDFDWLIEAHQLLRRHGQEVCKRTAPLCPVCALASDCAFARAHAP